MKDMFFNYDNDTNISTHCSKSSCHQADTQEIVRDITGKFLGLKIPYKQPTTLYFNIKDLGSPYLAENYLTLGEVLLKSKFLFEIQTTNYNTIIRKEYEGINCVDSDTCDCLITLDLEDFESLKQETYRIKLSLIFEDDIYEIFSNRDGFLIIR